ncbi:MAG: TetR/AcrR family transcriptional regulator [Alphaproteobacteria bacterium]|nr:TetR/AcrR family transcriptional regulator [Alphaproteobacteria bacterium]
MTRGQTNTKDRLIKTAKELIWRDSYNATSVDEICVAADVKKGSFYHFFPSKAHLALATMDSCMQETIENYDDIFSRTRPPLERFTLMARHVYKKQQEISAELGHVCGCPYATLGSEIASEDEEIAEKISDICAKKTAYYETALQDLISEGLIPESTDVKIKSEEIFAFLVGQLLMARIKNDLSFIEHHLKDSVFSLIGVDQEVVASGQNQNRKKKKAA